MRSTGPDGRRGAPRRLRLSYTDASDAEVPPYVLHRAPLGTHERFVAFLLEHYGGAFPTWLAPVQVRLLTVADRFREYAERICADLREEIFRAEVDRSGERMGKQIHNATHQKIPNLVIIGEREVKEGTVTLRRHGAKEQLTLPAAELVARLCKAVRTRSASFPTD